LHLVGYLHHFIVTDFKNPSNVSYHKTTGDTVKRSECSSNTSHHRTVGDILITMEH